MSRLRIAVIGGGHLGTIHANLLAQVPDAELVAIVEPNDARATELRDQFDCDVVSNVELFVARAAIDGAIVAAPTSLHHQLGIILLQRGVHCLIEKPLAASPAECLDLVSAAKRGRAILQVGHVERFNPAWTTLSEQIGEPRFIDATREGTLTFRSMDGGVVLDLMIHDIDLILSLVNSPVTSVQASGFCWTGSAEDIAQSRLTFANGCVARISASRVSCEPKRQMRIYGDDWFSEVDFGDRRCHVIRANKGRHWQSRIYTPAERQQLMDSLYETVLSKQDLTVPEGNAILDEQRDFVTSISTGTSPVVTGEDGAAAVELAHEVIRQFRNHDPAMPLYRKAG